MIGKFILSTQFKLVTFVYNHAEMTKYMLTLIESTCTHYGTKNMKSCAIPEAIIEIFMRVPISFTLCIKKKNTYIYTEEINWYRLSSFPLFIT